MQNDRLKSLARSRLITIGILWFSRSICSSWKQLIRCHSRKTNKHAWSSAKRPLRNAFSTQLLTFSSDWAFFVHHLNCAVKTRLFFSPFSRWLFLAFFGSCHIDIAASMSWRHVDLYKARHLAVARPKLSGHRSSSTVLNQVCLGLPVLRRQPLGGPGVQAWRAREWSWLVSAGQRWKKKNRRRRRIVSDRSGWYETEPRH